MKGNAYGQEVEKAVCELRRLLGAAEEISAEALLGTFADPEGRAAMYQRRSLGELRAHFSEAAKTASPSSREAMAAAIGAFWRWARDGFAVVNIETYERRLAACRSCDHYVAAPNDLLHATVKLATADARICDCCGCFMEKKARQANARCPVRHEANPGLSRWGEPFSTEP
jgi:hypothetical protein